METHEAADNDLMPKYTIWSYYVLLVVSVIIAILGVHFKHIGDLILIIPIIMILIEAIVSDRHVIHIPPFIIILMMLTFFISFLGMGFRSIEEIGFIASILQGVNLMMIGLVCLYALMRGVPRNMGSPMVVLIAECVSIAIFTVVKVMQYYISGYWDPMAPVDIGRLMEEMLGVLVGSTLIALLFLLDSTQRYFGYLLNTFMRGRNREVASSERLKQDAMAMMRAGESDKVEFKSTMRTNLETGEKDKRMEKAVLKTLVAYLNSEGGTLLIGVNDEGEPLGLEADKFESTDKMNLHFTHMISNAIGDEFLPYIWFSIIDIEGKQIFMVNCDKCKKPVFYREGKVEEFYVRSGPSSIILSGKSLVNYVSNRSKKTRERILNEVRYENRSGRRYPPCRAGRGFRKGSLLFLSDIQRLLGLAEGPGDQQGHDDGEHGDDEGVNGEPEEVVLGVEDGSDRLFDSLVPCQCRDETKSRGDEGREGLEELNLEFVGFSRHEPITPLSIFSDYWCGGGDSNP